MRCLALALLVACGGDAEVDALGPDTACGPECDGPLFPMTAHWMFFPVLGGPSSPCPAGVANVEVHFASGGMFVFPCTAGHGDAMVPLGRDPRAFGRAVDAMGAAVTTSVPRVLGMPGNFSIGFYPNAGFVRVLMASRCGSTPLPPASLGAADANGVSVTRTFDCDNDGDYRHGAMISDPLRPGTYDLTIALGPGSPVTRQGIVVGTNNAITDVDLTTQ